MLALFRIELVLEICIGAIVDLEGIEKELFDWGLPCAKRLG